MHKKGRVGAQFALVFIVLTVLSSPLWAIELRFADSVTVSSNEVIDETLIASGGSITIAGTVNGDVVVWGGFVKISGTINGSLHACGGFVSVEGVVTGNLWAAGGNLSVPGQVMGDMIVAGGIVDLGASAEVDRDLFFCAGMTSISGSVGKDVGGGGGQLNILGSVTGTVDVETDELTLHPGATIGGDLIHPAKTKLEIKEGAQIVGEHVEKPAKPMPEAEVSEAPEERRGPGVITIIRKGIKGLMAFIAPLLVGLLIILASPKQVILVSDKMWNSPWLSLGIGFLFFITLPIAALILGITLIGLPLGIFVLFFYIIGIYLSKILVSVFLGREIFRFTRREDKGLLFLALLLGFVALTLLMMIPYLGWLVWLVAIILGLGAFLITRKESWQAMREKKII